MRMSVEEMKDFSTPKSEAPNYPYGLKLSLGPDELEKLGIQDAPELDKEMTFTIKACVVEVQKDDREGDEKKFRVELQDKEMVEVKKEKSATEALYGV